MIIAQSTSYIQIFLQGQVDQECHCLPAALGGQVGLIGLVVLGAPFDLLAPSVLYPLLSLSGKNITYVRNANS